MRNHLIVFLMLIATTNLKGVNVVKGYNKLQGYKTHPKVLSPSEAWTSPQFYKKDNNWRHSVYSGDQGQIVVMTINPKTNPGNDVPNEVHDFDQFILVQEGTAEVSFNGGHYQEVQKGGWILAPAFTKHHIKNKSQTDSLKLLSFYTKWDTQQPSIAYKTLAEEESTAK